MKNNAPSSEFEDEDKCPSCGSPCDIHTDLDENDECNECGNNIQIIQKEGTKQELPKSEIDWSKFPKSTQKQVSEKYFRGLGEKDDEKSFIQRTKQETLEEAAYRLSAEKFEPKHIGFMLGVIEGAKWQKEQDLNMVQGYLSANLKNIELLKRMYSEEDLRKAIQLARLCTLDGNIGEFVDLTGLTEVCTYGLKETHSEDLIIEQFKKK